VRFHSTPLWNFWASTNWLDRHSKSITPEIESFPDLFANQIKKDFGYSIFPPRRGESYDAQRMDLVLDPSSQGGAHTGSVFGPFGISLSPDAVYNSYEGEVGFWFRILSLHETVNVWTGRLASGWIWADGSELWQGKSPFPNMADCIILEELSYGRTARAQRDRMLNDPTVRLFFGIQQKYGWKAYQGLFEEVKRRGIMNWHAFDEPLRTAVTILLLSRAAGSNLLQDFQGAGIRVSEKDYAQAESIFS
jgi:hypothetical protein